MRAETFDPDWISWLDAVALAEWQEYMVLNDRCNAMYMLEADEEFFAKRSSAIRRGIRDGRYYGSRQRLTARRQSGA